MRIYNEPLSKHTTFKIGGPARVLSIPENENELIDEIRYCQKENIKYRIIGNGSNLLISDKGFNGIVIKNTKSCSNIERACDTVNVGSSVSLKKFVRFCVENNLEGMEYLYSIPATVGGSIYMNAGRGKKYNLSISDNLISVRIFDGKKIKTLNKDECEFDFRTSIFHKHKNWIILEEKFKLDDQPRDIGEKKIKERMEFVRNSQNRSYPNAGSVFKKSSSVALRLLKGLRIGDAKIQGNWICNLGKASFKDVLWLIRISMFVSYLTFKKPELEIEIWEN